MNFVFISPVFPKNYYLFCNRLKKNGVNVLGIGDTPYEELSMDLKNSLSEYYRVNTLESYNEVFKAVAYFSYKFGKIDFLESNNEYWLRQDARLREDFNIPGPKPNDVLNFTTKSRMKEFYKKAGVPCARYKIITEYYEDLKFIEEVGYPVVVKPNVGVGAAATYKIKNIDDFNNFYSQRPHIEYIMEEFIDGEITTLDGLCDNNSNILFSDSMVVPNSLMDTVNENLELMYYINKEVPYEVYQAGSRVIKAFNIKSRYFHLEFFRLKTDKHGLGKAGDIVALEVNMRPPGGFTPDMINYSQSIDTYQGYADIICYNKIVNTSLYGERFYCVYVGRRNRFSYAKSYDEIRKKYSANLLQHDYMSEVFSGAMGNEFYIAKFKTFDEVKEFYSDVSQKNSLGC